MAKTSSIPRYYNRSKPIPRNIPSSPSKSNGSATLLTDHKGKDSDSEEDQDQEDDDEEDDENNIDLLTSHKPNHDAPESSLWMFQSKPFGTAQKGSLGDNSTNLLGGVTAPWDMEGMSDQDEQLLGADTSQLFPIPKANARNSAKRPVSNRGSLLLSPNRTLLKGQRLKNLEPDTQQNFPSTSALKTHQPALSRPGSSKDTLPLGPAELNTLENPRLRRDMGRAEVEPTISQPPGANLASRLSSVPPDLPPSAIKKHAALGGAVPKSTKKARFAPSEEEDSRPHVVPSKQHNQITKTGLENRTIPPKTKARLENEPPIQPANDVFGPKDDESLYPSNSPVPASLVPPISPDRPSYPISHSKGLVALDTSVALKSRLASETNVPAPQNPQVKRSKTHTPLASFNRVSRSPSTKQKSIQGVASQSVDPSLTRASSMSKTELLKPTRTMRNLPNIAASSQHKMVKSSSEDSNRAPIKPHTRQQLVEPSQTTSRLTKQAPATSQAVTDTSSASQVPGADFEAPHSMHLGVTSTSSNPTGSSGGASDATEVEELRVHQHAIPVKPSSNLTNRIHVSEMNARRLSTLIELPTPNSTFDNQKSASTIRNSLDTTDLSILSKAEGFPNTSTPYHTGPISLPLPPDTIRLSASRPKRSARRSSIGLSPIKGPSIVPLDMSNVSVQVKSVKNIATPGQSKSNREATSQASSDPKLSNEVDTSKVQVSKSSEPSSQQHRPSQPRPVNTKSIQPEPNAKKRADGGDSDRCQGTSSQQAPDSSTQATAAKPSKSQPHRLASGEKTSRKQELALPSTNPIPNSRRGDARRVSDSAPISNLQSQRLPKSRGQDDQSRSCSAPSHQQIDRTDHLKQDKGTKQLDHEKVPKRDLSSQVTNSKTMDGHGVTRKTSRGSTQTTLDASSKAQSFQLLTSATRNNQEEPIVGASLPSKEVTEDYRIESGSVLGTSSNEGPRLAPHEQKRQPAQKNVTTEGKSENDLSSQSLTTLQPSKTELTSSVPQSHRPTVAAAPIPSVARGAQSSIQPSAKRTLSIEGERPQASEHTAAMSTHPPKRAKVPAVQPDPSSKTRRSSKSRQSAMPSESHASETGKHHSKAKSHDLAGAADVQKPSSGATSTKHVITSNLPIVTSKSGQPGKVVLPQAAPPESGLNDSNHVLILDGASTDESGRSQDLTQAKGNPPSIASQISSKHKTANHSEHQEALHPQTVATVQGETRENKDSRNKPDITSASPKHSKRKRTESEDVVAQTNARSQPSRRSDSATLPPPAQPSTRKKSRDSHIHAQSDSTKDLQDLRRAAVSPVEPLDEIPKDQAVPFANDIDLVSPPATSTSATMFTIALEAPTDPDPSPLPEHQEPHPTSVSEPTASIKPGPPPLLTLPKAFTFSVRSGTGSGERIKDKREKAMQAASSNATSSQKLQQTHKPTVAAGPPRPKVNARPREDPSDIANERATKRTRTVPTPAAPARPQPTNSTRPKANLAQRGAGIHSRVRAAIGRLNKLAQVSQPGPPIRRPQTKPAPSARPPVAGPSNPTLNLLRTSPKQNIVAPEPPKTSFQPHTDHLTIMRSNLMKEIREKNLAKTRAPMHEPSAASEVIIHRSSREKGKEKAVDSDVLQPHSHRVTDEAKSSDVVNRSHLGTNSRRGLEARERPQVTTSRNVPNGSRVTSQKQTFGTNHNSSRSALPSSSTGFQKCLNQWREVEARKLQTGEAKAKKQIPWNDVSLVHHELPIKDFKERPNMPDFKLATQRRAKEREDWEQTKAVKERYEQQIKDQEEMRRLEREREEYIQMRKDRIVKANPVPDYLKRSN